MRKYSWKRQLGNAAKTSAGWTKTSVSNSFISKIFRPASALAFLVVLSGIALAAPMPTSLYTESGELASQAHELTLPAVQSVGSVSVQANIDGQSSDDSQPSVEVKVNGEEVPLDEDGSTSATVQTGDGGSVNVNMNVNDDDVSARIRSRSSTKVRINSSTDFSNSWDGQ